MGGSRDGFETKNSKTSGSRRQRKKSEPMRPAVAETALLTKASLSRRVGERWETVWVLGTAFLVSGKEVTTERFFWYRPRSFLWF